MLRILFCGLGSIGSRHIKNLTQLLRQRGLAFEIDALRSGGRPLREGVPALLHASYPDAASLPGPYDIVFVTNPTALHEDTVRALAPLAGAMFIEKPVFSGTDVDLAALGLRPDGVYYVACPLRHTPVVRRLKALCEREHVAAARTICSSYLPEWRPGTDYRECYSAHAELGGGVVLDLIHEWDYLSWLFGLPLETEGFCGHFSPLEITSDDVAVYAARYRDLLLSLQLDYIGRAPRRETELYCADETYVGDLIKGEVRHLRSGETETLPKEDLYLNEMNYFLDCALGRVTDTMNTPAHALGVLRIAEKAKRKG